MKRTFLQSLALYATVIFTLVMILFPVYWLLVTALSTTDELYRLPPTFWPEDAQWDIFARVWAAKPILLWLWNSMLAAIGSVALSMLVSVSAGYALSRYSMRGGATMGLFVLTAKMLPATLLVIPLFSIFSSFGLIGSLWTLVLAHSTMIIPFATWMLKGYFDTIPKELEQAAMVDGCSPIGAMVRVVLPNRHTRSCSHSPLCLCAQLGRLCLCAHLPRQLAGQLDGQSRHHHDAGRIRHLLE